MNENWLNGLNTTKKLFVDFVQSCLDHKRSYMYQSQCPYVCQLNRSSRFEKNWLWQMAWQESDPIRVPVLSFRRFGRTEPKKSVSSLPSFFPLRGDGFLNLSAPFTLLVSIVIFKAKLVCVLSDICYSGSLRSTSLFYSSGKAVFHDIVIEFTHNIPRTT